ncbi:MAG TPA: glycosyltransferase family 87 protein [Pirellulales bacterium]|nr:glycosyltransferase family 87 protein [Pirellulales bacterium]
MSLIDRLKARPDVTGWLGWCAAHEERLRTIPLLIAAAVFAVQGIRAGVRVEDGDFYLHWQFARRFVYHELLYADGLHVPYPPFWAAVWSPIAGMPLQVAKMVCYPLSIAALGVVLWILNRLTGKRLPLSERALFWGTVAALAIVSRFLVRELPECGPNLLLMALAWSAVYLWTRHRDVAAGLCLGLATAMKCTPAIFIAWFAWKRQWRLAATSVAASAAFFLAPAIWQGPADYERHVRIWLMNVGLGAGQVDPTVGVLGPETLQNLSLRPALARFLMHLSAGHPSRLDHPGYLEFLDLSPVAAGRITKLALVALLACAAWAFRKPVVRRDDLSLVWECAAVGALALLLSPITWYQHCVALLPVFYLFTRTAAARGRPAGWMWAVVSLFLLVVVVLNRGLIGRDTSLLLASYHLTTWAVLGAFALALGGTARSREAEEVATERTVGLLLFSHLIPVSLRARFSWTGTFLAIGLVLRLYHYLRDPSLWHDEAALVINVLDKSFLELLGPLRFSEAAPPLFLWLEKGVSLIAGESLLALRFAPLAASCAALVLFVPVARRVLHPAAVPWAVLLFAVSDRLLWHACEAKQYAVEAFAAVVLMAAWAFTRAWSTWQRAALLALLAPALLWLAYPAAFVYGGLLIVLLIELLRSKRAFDWFGYGLLCVAVFVAFGLLLAGPIHAQRDETIVACWDTMNQFPDWGHPARVPVWMIRSTCDLVGYCIKPVGQWMTPLALVGLVLLWRDRKRDWCLLLVVPILLALAGSCIKAYPYGGMRVMAYAAPAVFLLVGAAVPWCLEQMAKRHTWAAAPLVALLIVPVVRAGYCVACPWERADCAAAAAYVSQHRQPDDLVTANHWEYLYYFRRLGRDFVPLETLALPRDRMWVVVTGAGPADREPCLALFGTPPWSTKERREFDRTTVLFVERRGSESSTSVAPLARRP